MGGASRYRKKMKQKKAQSSKTQIQHMAVNRHAKVIKNAMGRVIYYPAEWDLLEDQIADD